MKSLVVIGIAVAMLGIGMPAMAADEDTAAFVALSKVTDVTSLQPMTDNQLTSVEGAGFCLICVNSAQVHQSNAAWQRNRNTVGFFVRQNNRAYQGNSAYVIQHIN
jgi:hypothetical protein